MREFFTDPESAFLAFKSGDEKGLEYFFNIYYTRLVYYAVSITGEEGIGEEIAAEAFVKLWQNREKVEVPAKLKNLLYNIVRNGSINHLRRRKVISLRTRRWQYGQDLSEKTVLQKWTEAETYHRLHRLLQSLPPRSRLIFERYYFQHKTLQEIADELGLTPGAIKSGKHRAIEWLRKNAAQLNAWGTVLLLSTIC